jgi:hypothetical protein
MFELLVIAAFFSYFPRAKSSKMLTEEALLILMKAL